MNEYIMNIEELTQTVSGIHYLFENEYFSDDEVDSYLLKEVKIITRFLSYTGLSKEESKHSTPDFITYENVINKLK